MYLLYHSNFNQHLVEKAFNVPS